MKSVERTYRDGLVDVANRVIMYEQGVTKLKHPRTARLAEVIGTAVSGAMLGFSVYIPSEQRGDGDILPPIKTRRQIGYGVLSATAAVGLVASYNLLNCELYL